MQRAEASRLLPSGVGHAAADAYRELRRIQHRARLDEQSTALDADAQAAQGVAAHRDAILTLWRTVFP